MHGSPAFIAVFFPKKKCRDSVVCLDCDEQTRNGDVWLMFTHSSYLWERVMIIVPCLSISEECENNFIDCSDFRVEWFVSKGVSCRVDSPELIKSVFIRIGFILQTYFGKMVSDQIFYSPCKM